MSRIKNNSYFYWHSINHMVGPETVACSFHIYLQSHTFQMVTKGTLPYRPDSRFYGSTKYNQGCHASGFSQISSIVSIISVQAVYFCRLCIVITRLFIVIYIINIFNRESRKTTSSLYWFLVLKYYQKKIKKKLFKRKSHLQNQ